MPTSCLRCEASLYRQLCGCWIDLTRQTRWCLGGKELHQPDGSTQPQHCPGHPAADAARSIR